MKLNEYNYKVSIINRDIFQEVPLKGPFSDGVVIGTTSNSKIRFKEEDYFTGFEIEIYKDKTNSGDYEWNISCSSNIYIEGEGIAKIYAMKLNYWDEIVLRYSSSDSELFRISFTFDFDDIKVDYKKRVNLKTSPNFCLGGTSFSKIELLGDTAKNDYITFTFQKDIFVVNINKAKYGVYLNGSKLNNRVFSLADYSFIMIDGYKFYYCKGFLYMDSVDESIVSHLPFEILHDSNNVFDYPRFVKSARVRDNVSTAPINVLPPEKKENKQESNILATILPSFISLMVMMFLRSQMNGNPIFIIYMGVTMGMGIVTSIITYIRNKKQSSEKEEKRNENYTKYIKEKEKAIIKEREKEKNILSKIYISENEIINEVRDFDYKLFEKTRNDTDFLVVRLGSGTIKAIREIKVASREYIVCDDPLIEYPEKLADTYRNIKNAPVTLDMKIINVLSVVGDRGFLFNMLKVFTIDIVSRHLYDEVKIYYVFDESDIKTFSMFRWLQNLSEDNTSVRNLIYDEQSKKTMFESLYKELSRREGMDEESLKAVPYKLVFIYNSDGFMSHPLSVYLDKAKDLHFVFIFFEEYREVIPRQTNYIINGEDNQTARLINVADASDNIVFKYGIISDSDIKFISEKLGCVYVDTISLESSLVNSLSLFKLLNIISVSDLDIRNRWRNSEVYSSMAAPIGVMRGDEILYLDLNEKAHGPHGLVAGTTGSGKSEILQTYILSMATLFHPYEVSFVIIDFKGGGMVNQFRNLPHLNGAITNIDGDSIDRSLSSIRAELRKRQELFAKHDVNHIDSYIKLYRNGGTEIPLPHLILIVDEFAELKNDQPEFMNELISTARIGRSLGVHLILATQKPAGVVNDQIWSNSKFKLCLKVQNKNDSNEVIKSPLAAEIKEPGRAYLQVGNNEIFELFQSAYSGFGIDSEQSGKKREYSINEVDLFGRKKEVFSQRNEKRENVQTQLDAIVDYINNYCKDNQINKLPGICLPDLDEVIIKDEKPIIRKECGVNVEIGIFDDPDNQRQDLLVLDIGQSNTVIIGSPQFGKTNVHQLIIKEIAENYSPDEVNIYILDFASTALKTFNSLRHVGGVITASDDEKMSNFINMMSDEIVRRKELLSDIGLSSFIAYKEAGYSNIPQIIIMIDNFTGLKETFFQREDGLLRIVRDGLSLGISFVISDVQCSGMGFRYLSMFSNKLMFYCNNDNEYSTLFGYCRKKPKNIPGRGIVDIDKKLYNFQAYLAFDGEKEVDRVRIMKRIISISNNKYLNFNAIRIPEVPEIFDYDYIKEYCPDSLDKAYSPVFGMSYKNALPMCNDFVEKPLLGIVGGDGIVNIYVVKNMLYQFIENKEKNMVELYIFDDYKKQFSDFESSPITKYYSINPEGISEVLNNLTNICEAVWSDIRGGGKKLDGEPLKLIVIQNEECIVEINNDKVCLERFKLIISKYKGLKLGVIVSNCVNSKPSVVGASVQKIIVENKNMIIIENINRIKICDFNASVQREFAKPLGKKDAYYLSELGIDKYKLLI